MKYDCSEEFDLNLIYAKLTSKSVPKVRACDFFNDGNDLEKLQIKMNLISQRRKNALFGTAK